MAQFSPNGWAIAMRQMICASCLVDGRESGTTDWLERCRFCHRAAGNGRADKLSDIIIRRWRERLLRIAMYRASSKQSYRSSYPPSYDSRYSSVASDASAYPLLHEFQPELSRPRSGWVRHLLATLLIFITVAWLSCTIFFAYNSTRATPLSSALMLPKPGQAILALSLLSHITILLLQALASTAFEAVRWAFAGSAEGVSAFSFLTLSRATGPLGVFYLLFFNSHTSGGISGHRLWSLNRLEQIALCR